MRRPKRIRNVERTQWQPGFVLDDGDVIYNLVLYQANVQRAVAEVIELFKRLGVKTAV